MTVEAIRIVSPRRPDQLVQYYTMKKPIIECLRKLAVLRTLELEAAGNRSAGRQNRNVAVQFTANIRWLLCIALTLFAMRAPADEQRVWKAWQLDCSQNPADTSCPFFAKCNTISNAEAHYTCWADADISWYQSNITDTAIYKHVGSPSCSINEGNYIYSCTGYIFQQFCGTYLCSTFPITDSGLRLVKDRWHDKPKKCEPFVGDPIYPLTASRHEKALLGRWLGMMVDLDYDTRRNVPTSDSADVFPARALPSFGTLWETTLHKQLALQSDLRVAVQASRGGGVWTSFINMGGMVGANGYYDFAGDTDVNDRIGPFGGGYLYYDSGTGAQELYDGTGALKSIQSSSGLSWTYTYSDSSTAASIAPIPGLLIKVQDAFGRSIQFTYEQPADSTLAPRIKKLGDPSGRATSFGYDTAGNLKQIAWPDAQVRQFLYERPTDLPWALTGILDENNARTSTYVYDTNGRAVDTQLAGSVEHYNVNYGTSPSMQIVDTFDQNNNFFWRDHYWIAPQDTVITTPNSNSSAWSANVVQGMPRLTSQSQPAGSGCNESTSSMAYDGNGNVTQSDDFAGHRSCLAYDASNREVARVEGLAASASTPACGTYTAANAALGVGSRKTSTQWHPLWRLATQVAEPGRITTSVYNGQPDPFNGGVATSCVTPAANLPDGSPIAVLCKRVEQATTDVDGHLGFAATLQPGVVNRVSSWTYNQYGQVLTSVDPLLNTTTSTYYTDTSFTGADPNAVGHTVGDLKTVQNAANKVTTYDKYDKNGNLLQSTDANGVVTVNTYDARQRLASTSVGGQLTGYAYWPTGLLKRVTQPDASYVAYGYDDAHRLTTVSDNLGNTITYTLDNMGNRTGEATKDSGGVLRRQMTRSMDALSRVQQTTGVQ